MRRAVLALVLLACHSPSQSPPLANAAASPVVVAPQRSPLDAVAEEAHRQDLAILVTRDGKVLYERPSASFQFPPIHVLQRVVRHLAARSNAPAYDDDWVLEHTNLLLHDHSGNLIFDELAQHTRTVTWTG